MRFLIEGCSGSVVVEILMTIAVSIVPVVAACGPSGMAAMHRTAVLVAVAAAADASTTTTTTTSGMTMISSTVNHITMLLAGVLLSVR
jgi:hypothetical protein